MSDCPPLPRTPSAPAPYEPRQLGWSHGPRDLSQSLVGHGPQAFQPWQTGSSGKSTLYFCGTPHLRPHGLGLPRNSSQVFGMSHGDDVQTIHGDQSTISPPAGHGNGKIQCDGPLSAAFYRRPLTAYRGGDSRFAGGGILHRPHRRIHSETTGPATGYTRQSRKGPIHRIMVSLFSLPQRLPLFDDITPLCMLCSVVTLHFRPGIKNTEI